MRPTGLEFDTPVKDFLLTWISPVRVGVTMDIFFHDSIKSLSG